MAAEAALEEEQEAALGLALSIWSLDGSTLSYSLTANP